MSKMKIGLETLAAITIVGFVLILANSYLTTGKLFYIPPAGAGVGVPGQQVGYVDFNPSVITGCAQAPSGALSVITPDLTKSPVPGPGGGLVYPTKLQATGANTFAQYPTHATLASQPGFGSSSTGAASVNTLSLGVGYLVTAGDQATILSNATKFNPGCNTNVPLTILAPAYSAPTILVANTVQNLPTANTILRNQGAGANTITFQFFVKGGTNFASEGPLLVSIADNSIAFPTCPSIGVPQATNVQAPAMLFVTTNTGTFGWAGIGNGAVSIGTQNQQCNYLIPNTWANQYSNPSGGAPSVSSTGGTYQLSVAAGSTFGANEVFSFQVTPATCNLNTVTGNMDCGLYKNPVTGANLVAPIGGFIGGSANVVVIAQP